eukprot:2992457-Prymnesium_polylepis.3
MSYNKFKTAPHETDMVVNIITSVVTHHGDGEHSGPNDTIIGVGVIRVWVVLDGRTLGSPRHPAATASVPAAEPPLGTGICDRT